MGYDMYREKADGDKDGYFRLNVWGMSDALPVLAMHGIVRQAPWPRVPQASDYGVTESFDEDGELTPMQAEYVEAIKQWRDGPSQGDAPGIPSYKFNTNDGWLVLPIEIQSGVRFADTNSPNWRNELPDWVLEFVVWMEGSEHGFRVW